MLLKSALNNNMINNYKPFVINRDNGRRRGCLLLHALFRMVT